MYSAVLIDLFWLSKIVQSFVCTFVIACNCVTSVIFKKKWSNEIWVITLHHTVTLPRYKGLEWICVGFAIPKTLQFCLFTVPFNSKLALSDINIFEAKSRISLCRVTTTTRVPLGSIPSVFNGHLTLVLELTVSCMEISVGLTARFGAEMILKALIIVLLLMFLDHLAHFRLHTLLFLLNAMPLIFRFVSY